MIALTSLVGLNNPHLKHLHSLHMVPHIRNSPSKPWFRLVLNMGEKIAFIPQLKADGF
jgi:hypothetical protein